jgi:hypothetical protein
MPRKKLPKPAKWRMILLGTILFVGLFVGFITVFKAGANQLQQAVPAVATGAQLEASRAAIAKQYLTCDIADITRADTVVRPENRSIDHFNQKLCEGLQQNKILDIRDL